MLLLVLLSPGGQLFVVIAPNEVCCSCPRALTLMVSIDKALPGLVCETFQPRAPVGNATSRGPSVSGLLITASLLLLGVVLGSDSQDTDVPSCCQESIEVQHEANAICWAKLKLTECLVVATEETAAMACEMSVQEECFLNMMDNLSEALGQLSLLGSQHNSPGS